MIRAQHLRRWLAGLGALSLMATSTLIIASSDAEAADSEHATFNVTCGPLGDHLNITFYTFPAGTIRWNAGTMYPSTVQTNGQPTTVVVGIHPGLNTAAVSWTDANGVAGSASAGATFTAPKCIPPSPYWVGMSSTGSNPGFLAVTSQGAVVAQGVQGSVGGVQAMSLNKPIVGIASLPQGLGYWLVASDGGIFAEGTARFYGSMGGQSLNKPIVGIASTPDGKGYWEVASDGGIFAFGDAQYFGSMGGKPLNQPIVGMAADAATGGYWLVAADGGIFAFNAAFYGSTGNISLNKPITGMEDAADGSGYRVVASDGGVFSFNLPFEGSAGANPPAYPVDGIAAYGDDGYWILTENGTVHGYGTAAGIS